MRSIVVNGDLPHASLEVQVEERLTVAETCAIHRCEVRVVDAYNRVLARGTMQVLDDGFRLLSPTVQTVVLDIVASGETHAWEVDPPFAVGRQTGRDDLRIGYANVGGKINLMFKDHHRILEYARWYRTGEWVPE